MRDIPALYRWRFVSQYEVYRMGLLRTRHNVDPMSSFDSTMTLPVWPFPPGRGATFLRRLNRSVNSRLNEPGEVGRGSRYTNIHRCDVSPWFVPRPPRSRWKGRSWNATLGGRVTHRKGDGSGGGRSRAKPIRSGVICAHATSTSVPYTHQVIYPYSTAR